MIVMRKVRLNVIGIVFLDEVDVVKIKRRNAKRELLRNIRALQTKLRVEKRRIQKELDRIQLEAGNRGYMVRNGKTTYVADSAVELDKIIIRSPAVR